MQFQVPQFLDVEDKIIGPFTIKQFIYLAGGIGMGYMSFRFIDYVGAILGLALVALGWALGFYKINGKPFIYMIEAAVIYFKNDRLYIWRRKPKPEELELDLSNFKPTKHATALTAQHHDSKLASTSWSIGMKESTEDEDLLT